MLRILGRWVYVARRARRARCGEAAAPRMIA